MLEQVTVIFPPERFEETWRGRLSATLAGEFPSLFVSIATEGTPPHLRSSEWEHPDFNSWQFDAQVDELAREPFTLCIADDRGERPAFPIEVVSRCQRLLGRRNRHSQGQLFDRVLRRHRQMHDVSKPLVRADYNHALDVWQWLLRLDAEASLPLQLAALFHDVERLMSEAEARVEHLAADYQQFKDAHAKRGAELTRQVLAAVGIAEAVRDRVAAIIAGHERQSDDAEVALLNDADALSFFSLNSSGYADYFGPEQTGKKVAYTLNRLRPAARQKLASVRLRADVQSLVNG